MILILADGTDPWSSTIHRELNCRGVDVLWAHPDLLVDGIQVNWPVKCDGSVIDGTLMISDRAVELADLTGVLFRLPIPLPLLLDDLSAEDRGYVTRETTAAWLALLDALPCAVVNRPVPGGRPTVLSCSAELARLTRQHGFHLLPSYCNRNKSDAITQLSAWGGRAYVKLLGSPEPGMFLDESATRDGDPFAERRSYFMQRVPVGQRVTVYVVAGEAVGTVVQPHGNPNETTILSPLLTEQCTRLTRELGLAFAQCELILGDDIYCLDVSASPLYWRCPHEIQHRIVEALADYLLQPKGVLFHDSLVGAHGRSGSR